MKKVKAAGFFKLIAFLLIATMLLCVFGFSAGGWQPITNTDTNSDNATPPSGDVDVNTDLPIDITPEVLPETELKYYDYLTGLSVSKEDTYLQKTAFVINSQGPVYGLSMGELVIEFPTESGTTRLLAYTKASSELGKIGSFAPTRQFISTLTSTFGGILISMGEDGVKGGTTDTDKENYFDLSKAPGYSYTEYTHYVYSNHALIMAGLQNNGFSLLDTAEKTLPYTISTAASFKNDGTLAASNAILSFSSTKSTELRYSNEDARYYLYENGIKKIDALYERAISFKNVFVLFSDSVTYESADYSELVLDTVGGGRGYYIADGTATEITWQNENGAMTFKKMNGEKLTVSAGESYIGFLKSSERTSLTLS